MMHARAAIGAEVHPAIVRRLELRLTDGDSGAVQGELTELAKKHAVAPVFQRRDHVGRLDVDLAGDPPAVDEVVQLIRNRQDVQTMRDEVLPPPGVQDPLYPDLQALRRAGARLDLPPQRAPLGQAAELEPDRPHTIVVAIVDSGIMTEHPDLRRHLSRGPGGRVRGRPVVGATIEDEDGHGTLLAGTVLAAAGRSRDVRVLPVKFIDGRTRPDSELAARAIRWAADNGADIIDLSWEVGIANPTLRAAIEYAGTQNALVVIAAGNSGADNDRRPAFPACYGHEGCSALPGVEALEGVITVMASDRFDDKAGFSNYGNESVHIAAPGVGVTSTHQTLLAELPPGDPGLYQRYDGSSAAAAFVAGAAALVAALPKKLDRKLSPTVIKAILMGTVDRRPDLRCKSGGRVNIDGALKRVQAILGAPAIPKVPAPQGVQIPGP